MSGRNLSPLDDAWLAVESVPERLEIKIPAVGPDRPRGTAGHHLRDQPFVVRVTADGRKHQRQNALMQHAFLHAATVQRTRPDVGRRNRPRPAGHLLIVLPEFGVHRFETRRECTGFVFNRVWAAIKREPLAVVAEGVARPEDVDGMFRVNWRVPVGPFQMKGLVGLDVVLDIENHYVDEFPYLPRHARDVLQRHVDAEKLGVKSGQGFYKYT